MGEEAVKAVAGEVQWEEVERELAFLGSGEFWSGEVALGGLALEVDRDMDSKGGG